MSLKSLILVNNYACKAITKCQGDPLLQSLSIDAVWRSQSNVSFFINSKRGITKISLVFASSTRTTGIWFGSSKHHRYKNLRRKGS